MFIFNTCKTHFCILNKEIILKPMPVNTWYYPTNIYFFKKKNYDMKYCNYIMYNFLKNYQKDFHCIILFPNDKRLPENLLNKIEIGEFAVKRYVLLKSNIANNNLLSINESLGLDDADLFEQLKAIQDKNDELVSLNSNYYDNKSNNILYKVLFKY